MKNLQILGTGCHKCEKLAELVESTANEMGIEYTLEKVTDIQKIMDFGVMITPALVVDGDVKIAGKVPSIKEIEDLLKY
ncbi:hypothetical protein AMJ71_09570 [candidate division TA06 bacterium SM1_40]|uniref:Thioredoxin-like fold domain-containing protein n=1 Tax=candidate division TA06 bacterium SM1_40 TaxID=1703773 RepID=A0A0S8JCR3_UNCT6|nr:MAG: hypothetical protein AMJ71_09570 [candidate division TA06 bacterium SM1_40]